MSSVNLTVLLGGGHIMEKNNLKKLSGKVAEVSRDNLEGTKAQTYQELGTSAWRYLGATSQKLTSERMETFCSTHRPFVERYQGLLEQIREELGLQTQSTLRHATTKNMATDLPAFKTEVRQRVKTLITLLNSHHEGFGYFLSGACNDHLPVKDDLVDLLCAKPAPSVAAEDIPDYILGGSLQEDNGPLVLMDSTEGLRDFFLPLKVSDIQEIFHVFHDLLSLTPENADDGVRLYASSFETAMLTLKKGILATSGMLNAMDTQEGVSNHVQNVAADEIAVLNDSVPFESSLDFYTATKALEVFLQYIVFVNASHERLRELTTPILLR